MYRAKVNEGISNIKILHLFGAVPGHHADCVGVSSIKLNYLIRQSR